MMRSPIPLLCVLLAAACGRPVPTAKTKEVAAQTPAVAKGAAEAHRQFESVCFTCHGSTGHGDGPGAGPLNPKPRSFADVTWQDSVSDEHIKKAIVFGGAAVGKNAMMPAHPQFKGKDAVLDGLVAIVRDFRGK
jgi:mono/diheme cytochrome c family protein